MKKFIPLLLSLLLAVPSNAQVRKLFDLKAEFGLNSTQTYALVSDLMTLDQAKLKYPQAYQRTQVKTPGAAGDALFMRYTAFDAAHMQGQWAGLGGGQQITDPNAYLVSYNPIVIPEGYYMASIIPEVSMNEISGAGGGWNTPNGTAHNTVIGIYHEKWNGDPNERHGFTSSTWGKVGGQYYTEGARMEDLRVDGRHLAAAGQTFNSTGFRLWQPGTGSSYRQLYALDCRTAGFEVFNPTPGNFYDITAMHCVEAGFLHLGGWGSTLFIHGMETDDASASFEQRAAYGYAAGGTIDITLKAECGLKAASVTPKRPQVGAILRGWFNGEITVRAIAKNQKVDALFVMEPVTYSATGVAQEPLSDIELKGAITEGYNTLIQQLPTPFSPGARWTLPDRRSFRVEYTSENDGEVWRRGRLVTREAIPCTARLGATTATGTFDYTTCSPAFAYTIGGTGTPPPACAFTYGAWTACTGTQTRSFTSSPAGCSGAPPADSLSRACTPPPTCTYTYSAWGACVNGTQSRTVLTSTPAGCTGTPGPLVQACSSTTPSYDINDVLVVVNSADPTSVAMGAAYVTAWGISVANVVTVDLGATPVLSNATKLTTARTAIDARGKEVTLLAMKVPSEYTGGQSITSAIMFGARTVGNLTVSPFYQYSGLKPRTDKGKAECFLLYSANYIRKDAHGTRPVGQSILLLAKDQGTSFPRGSARATQSATGVTVWDNRNTTIGTGNNACNYISTLCWISSHRPTAPIVAAYQSMFFLGDAGTTTWAKGFYGDHVTSIGGALPPVNADGTNAGGQTTVLYELDKGASMSVGSVSEPWQGNTGSLAQQFVNVGIFHPLFLAGKPVGAACYAAVQCPDRMLFVGDPLCAPFK